MNTAMKETMQDPACMTADFSQTLDLEVKDLLCRDRILELEDFDAEKLLLLYAEHRGNMQTCMKVIDRYIVGLAENLAYEICKWEYER